MKASTILEALQREYYIARTMAHSLWEDYLKEKNKQKADDIYRERTHWLYIASTLRSLLHEFGVEVV